MKALQTMACRGGKSLSSIRLESPAVKVLTAASEDRSRASMEDGGIMEERWAVFGSSGEAFRTVAMIFRCG